MRVTFLQFLVEQAAIDPNLYLIAGDVGFSVIEEFQRRYPTRYFNAGVAEQNMVGVAAGLAMAGKNVYVYTFIPFLTMRAFEQIRVDVCYQELPVKLIGVGGGLSYGGQGATHHSIEDIALMRSLPTMTVVVPGSTFEVQQLCPQINVLKKPVYMRLSNYDQKTVYPSNSVVTLGKAVNIIPSSQALIIATGNALDLAYGVCNKLRDDGLDIGLVSMPTIKPLDKEFLMQQQNLRAIFTIEEHSIIGGLGEAVASLICENYEQKIIFKSFGINDFYFHEAGSRAYLNERAGLSIQNVATEILMRINTPAWKLHHVEKHDHI